MQQDHSNEYNTETDSSSGAWPADLHPTEQRPPLPWESRAPSPPTGASPQYLAARGFGQTYGLHPIPAVTTLVVNAMLFGGTVFTMGALIPLAIGVAAVLGILTYRAQMRFYQDDSETAAIKAAAITLITAIPVGLPAFLTLPSSPWY